MIVADYESEADSLEIELEKTDTLSSADDSVHPKAIVHLLDGRPIVLDILGASEGIDEPLAAVAKAYGLDPEALLAAGCSALSAPGRRIELSVAVRA